MERQATQHSRQGVILLNLGTPEEPTPKQVGKYLYEFLMDPLVIDIPYLLRWVLIRWAILPKRSVSSAAAYRKVWTERGSPLLFHLLDLASNVQKVLGNEWVIKPAMRYGSPSIAAAFDAFRQESIREILLFPLYPQYSSAATESSIRECQRLARLHYPDIKLRSVPAFYKDDLFIKSIVEMAKETLTGYSYDHILFSFHGLPERQIKKTDLSSQFRAQGNLALEGGVGPVRKKRRGLKPRPDILAPRPLGRGYCLVQEGCCNSVKEVNQNCYRAHCFATATAVAQHLNLSRDQYTVCFQSRMGRTPWIKPFTDEFYRELPKKGVKKLAVFCPSFVADCLETLEEVRLRGRDEFIQNGGEDLVLVPSLNSSSNWVEAVCRLIRDSESHSSC